jgi:hypothetical protein
MMADEARSIWEHSIAPAAILDHVPYLRESPPVVESWTLAANTVNAKILIQC